jgi:hypothetical protein
MANLAMDATDDHIRDFCEKMGPVSTVATVGWSQWVMCSGAVHAHMRRCLSVL